MKYKTTIIPILAIAAVIPAVLFGISSDAFVQTQEKIVTEVTFDENKMDLQKLTSSSELVIEGKILSMDVFTQKVHDNQVYPDIFTKAQVQVVNVLKGYNHSEVIPVVLHGGEIENRISTTESIELENNDNVIFFLEHSGAYYSKDAYNLIAPIQGNFLIQDGIVKSAVYPEMELADMKQAISLAQELN